jgi:hypothetical protein
MSLIETEKVPGRVRHRRLVDQTGRRFGRLTAVSFIKRDPSSKNDHLWLFRCDCGTDKVLTIWDVRSGHTASCGCLARERLAARNRTHGLSKSTAYRVWKDMRARCRNPNDSDFADYGGRGISVCERWDDFPAFLADMGERPGGTTLDRIDVDGNYEPGNCRWASGKAQANNKRSNLRLELNGQVRTLQEWSDEYGIGRSTVRWRLRQGWSLLDSLTIKDARKKP